jgi:hypothetical protein
MRAQHRSSVPGWLRLLLSMAALGLSLPAMVSSFTSAGLVAVATVARGAAAHAPVKSAKPMFGALGKYITTAEEAKRWAPHGRQAYRVDIPIMSSMNPIRYRTVFQAPVGLAGMRAAGVKLVLTVRNGPWNTDLPLPANGSADAAFKAALKAMIDQLHPDYIVYGNEVDTPAKYSGTAAQFKHLMKLGHAVAASKGVKDGGAAMVGTIAAEATYADIKATQGKAAARKFRKASGMGPFHQALAEKANAYIDACKAAGVDYFVWHSYFSDPSVILSIKSYVEKRFGGPSFINELGWRTGSAKTGTRVLDALSSSGMPIVLLYGSGIGPNAPDQLWTTAGSPTAEGKIVLAHLSNL